MFEFRKNWFVVVMVSLMLLVAGCGSSAQQEAVISTAVAQTVQAEDSLTEIASQPTITPLVTLPAVTTPPAVTPTSAPTLAAAPADPNCAKATLVDESPPDGIIMRPGQYYWN